MKKFLSIFLVLIIGMSVILSGCENTKDNQSDLSSQTDLADTNINANENAQVETGTYVCEYKDYILYRNTNDNGSLYRYNVKDNSYIKLFGENAFPFLHSIKVFEEMVYFVTKTETDTSPTLYRISINGGEAERLVEHVCDDYAVTKDAIYYTGFQCPCHNGADYLLHKYTFADKKADTLVDDKKTYKQFNLKGDKIYCLVISDNYTAYGLACFDIKTETTTTINTGKVKNDFQYAVSANGGKIIYLTFNYTLYSYNIESGEFKEIIKNPNLIGLTAVASDDLMYFWTSENRVKKAYQCKNGIVSQYTAADFDNDIIEVIDGKPVFFTSSNTNSVQIEGDNRLNVVVKDS